MNTQQRERLNFRTPRDKALTPLTTFATKHSITPNMVSIAGVVSMILFFLTTYWHVYAASVLFLAISVFADLLDGSLARFQHISTDAGKKFDLIIDNITFDLFMITLGITHLMSLSIAILIIILQLIVAIQSTHKAKVVASHTGLHMHEIQGPWFVISLVKALMYISFIVGIGTSGDVVAIMRLIAVILLAFSLVRSTLKKA